MIIYYDIVGDKEVASDAFDEKVPIKGIKAIHSKRLTIVEGEVDIGANAAKEATEDDEGVDQSEAQSVINVVYASKLAKIDIDKKEYKTLQKAYWKKLLDTLNDLKWDALGVDKEELPADKKLQQELETSKLAEIKPSQKVKYEDAKQRVADFKANFDGLQKFVQDEILANFEECEFYTHDDAELGSCMLIPARYIGEATAPIFYIFQDGIREKKE
jgi:hypothetical protein